jgi:hypothetical protein
MKGRKTRATGGVNAAAEDLATRPMEYTKDSNVNRAALERKRGGKAGMMPEGLKAKMNAGRKPRKSGGRLKIADWSAAQKGTPAKGRTTDGSLD